MKAIKKFFKDNALIIFFSSCFLGSFWGLILTGIHEAQAEYGLNQINLGQYLASGSFLEAVFSNCQAAILQLTFLIVFGIFMRQRGAVHSRKLPGQKKIFKKSKKSKTLAKVKKTYGWIYENSLSLAFILLFIALFVLHIIFGTVQENEMRALKHENPVLIIDYFVSWKFWFATFQTWQAEFFALTVYFLLSIFLRQKNSPESKPIESKDSETGNPNE